MTGINMIQLTEKELEELLFSVAKETAEEICSRMLYFKDKATLAKNYYRVSTRTLQNKPWMIPDFGLRNTGWSLMQVEEWNKRPLEERQLEYRQIKLARELN